MSSWCRFRSPTKGHRRSGLRVVVSNRAYITARPDLIVMAITS